VQYDPKFGKPDENRETITNVLTQVRGRFDVLLLPEMAFSGYMFENKEEVDPFCEKCGEGPTFNWCSKIAKEYNSIVVVGYPEKDNSKYYNRYEILILKLIYSAYVVGVNGELVENVRKHFLYDTDYKWAEEGAGFHSTQVSISKDQSNLRLGFGICMDLNPKGTIILTELTIRFQSQLG
jgi:protein N-terminal amidase